MRQCIERAFALLVERWGIFWRPLRCAYRRWFIVCTVAAKLHNYAIDMNEGKISDVLPRSEEDCEIGDQPAVYMNKCESVANIEEGERSRPAGDRRREMTAQGIRRPHWTPACSF